MKKTILILAAGLVVSLSTSAFNYANAETKTTSVANFDNKTKGANMQRAIKKHPALKAKLRGNDKAVRRAHFKKFAAAHPEQAHQIINHHNNKK